MFRFLGTAIQRAWPVWLLAWIGVFALLAWTAPPWDKVAQDREYGFLPTDAPTRKGEALFRRAFPDDKQKSNVVIVISRANEELRGADWSFISKVIKPALMKFAKDEGGLADKQATSSGASLPIIAAIRTPDDPGSGVLLESDDGQAALVVIELTTELLEVRNWPIVEKVENLIAAWRAHGQLPSGLNLNLIGSATVGRDMTRGQNESAASTEFWTIIIVIVILALVYRAPFLAMIPLVSVFMATMIARLLLAHLAQAGWVTLFGGIEIYITVILYGTGVDYCLFLIARYREERERGADWGDALAETIHRLGPALAASAATVIFGIGMMTFARFGKFHHAGIAVAFSLVVSLCVVLTFTTSLLRMAGHWAFWPKVIAAKQESPRPSWWRRLTSWFSWDTLAGALMRWPGLIWLAAVLVMSPLAIGGMLYGDEVDYDFVKRLPPNAPSITGTKALQEHFPAGMGGGIVTVLIYQPNLDFLAPDGKGQIEISVLTDRLRDKLQLANLRSWSRPLGSGWAANEATGAPLKDLERGLKRALHYYVSSSGTLKGHVTRMELTIFQNPLSREGIEALNGIEQVIRSNLYGELRDADLYFLGATADMRDLRNITGSDQVRIQILVTVSVLVILMILLRRPGVSLYLIVSVLFSYFATLGAAYGAFSWLEGDNFVGLDWKVPIFLFTILVAIGEDYNIFLMTRVAEEQAEHGPLDGIRFALVRTGRIITSCGIIMAGTFSSLMFGSMQDLHQLGFALAFGVLVDTFVVRPILVPAFLIVFEQGKNLWEKLARLPETTGQPPSQNADTPSVRH